MKNERYIKKATKLKSKSNSFETINQINNIIKDEKELSKENAQHQLINNNISKNQLKYKKSTFNKISSTKKIFKHLILIIFIIITNKTLAKEIKIRKLESYSEIRMAIIGIGNHNILYENFSFLPDEVIINNISQTIENNS